MTKVWIILAGVAIVIAAGVFYVTSGGKGLEEVSTDSSVNEEAGIIAVKGSMQDLIAQGGAWKCEFTHKTDVSDSTGIVYVSNGMIRGNFISQVPQLGEVKSSMIARDTFIYTWSDMMPQGFKMPMSPNGPFATAQGQTNFYAEALDYNCIAWEADLSLFEVPTTVTFMEISQ